MESDSSPRPVSPATPQRAEWRTLARLRERVQTTALEIERLRTENAALAQRVLELQNSRAEAAPELALAADGEDADALKARIEGFIRAIDDILDGPDTAEAAADTPAADAHE